MDDDAAANFVCDARILASIKARDTHFEAIASFFLCLAVCHTVIPDVDTKTGAVRCDFGPARSVLRHKADAML